jgi:hypothetical protein
VHYEACRFVHYQDVLVLEEDRDGDLLGRYALLGDARLHALSVPDPVGRRGLAAIDEQEIVFDESLHEATADPEPPRGQGVDTLPSLRGVYSEGRSLACRDGEPLLTPAQKAAGP